MTHRPKGFGASEPPIRPRFDLVDLILFANVARHESLTRGAMDTALSVGAASIRIRSIEQTLGTDLFFRTKRGVKLTTAGDVFRQGAETILRDLQQMHDNMQDVLHSQSGHVRVAANVLAVMDVLPPVLGSYLRRHPGVSVDIEEVLSPNITQMVRQGQADMGIVIGDIDPADDIEIFPYRPFHWVVVVPTDHVLAGVECVRLRDILDYDFVGRNVESSVFTVLQHMAKAAGKELRMRARIANFDGMCRLVAAGAGISVVPRETALRHSEEMDIVVIEADEEWAHRSMQICVRKDWAMPPFAKDLLDFLLNGASELYDARTREPQHIV